MINELSSDGDRWRTGIAFAIPATSLLRLKREKSQATTVSLCLEAWRHRGEGNSLSDETVDLREIKFERFAPHVSPSRRASGKLQDLTFHKLCPLALREKKRFPRTLWFSCGYSAAGPSRKICQLFIPSTGAVRRWAALPTAFEQDARRFSSRLLTFASNPRQPQDVSIRRELGPSHTAIETSVPPLKAGFFPREQVTGHGVAPSKLEPSRCRHPRFASFAFGA